MKVLNHVKFVSVTRDPEAVSRFVERFASVLVDGGVPRMPARVFAALLASDTGRLTAAELAEALQVSPAAVSGAVRYLTQVSLVGREREPGSRRDLYRLHDDVWYEAIVRPRAAAEPLGARARRRRRRARRRHARGRRLAGSAEFFEFLQREMPALLARWREQR